MTEPHLPKSLATFLGQDAGSVLLGTAAAGSHPRVGVRAPDAAALRATSFPPGVLSATVGVYVDHAPAAVSLVPRPEWPPLTSMRARAAQGGWWTVLRFAAPVDVAVVLGELGRQSVWRWTLVPVGAAVDVRLINPVGFLGEATEPVVDLATLDLRDGVTPALVASLRPHLGVEVTTWDTAAEAAVPALALAGVPVIATSSPVLTGQVGAPVDLTDPIAREEHSLLLRRAAFDTLSGLADSLPSVTLLLATRRPEMLDFALGQVARQRGVASLELVLAPHGFDPDPAAVRAAVPNAEVRVLPHGSDVLFGDVLQAAAVAARGEVVMKIDDDDWYAPDVVADLLRARAYSGADLVGMSAELHYLTGPDLTVKRGHPTERFVRFVAGGTTLLPRALLMEIGGFRQVRKYVDAQLIEAVIGASGAVYRTHGLGYVLRRNPTGHTWEVDQDYLLDPRRTVATRPGFRPSRLMELDASSPYWPAGPSPR